MNKKILIIVGVIIVLGLVAYFTMGKKEAPNQLASNTRLADDTNMAPNQSLKDLLLGGKALKCEFKDDKSASTFYMADQKVRGDVLINAEANKTMKSHMIVIDKVSYTWVEGEKTGFKIAASESDVKNNSEANQAQNQEAVNLDKKMDYKCSNWSKDSSYFELPVGVEFKDLSSLLPSMTPKSPANNETNSPTDNKDLKNTQCAVCDSAPAESRAQCKAALGCK